MGSTVTLYHHPEAARIVTYLNTRNRCWHTDRQQFYAMCKEMEWGDNQLPNGTEEIIFRSNQPPGICPTCQKIHYLGDFLECHGLTSLNTVFGYASWEPEDFYRLPDWPKSLELIEQILSSFPSQTCEPPERVKFYYEHLEAFKEMLIWINQRDDPSNYFLCWSA
jgi:hypothetical protein